MYIQLSGIEKSFNIQRGDQAVHVLKSIDLSIDKGELVAIKGASGSGKSTLLHLLGCLDKPSKGHYLLDGMDVTKASPAQLSKIRNQKIGFVLQHFALIEDDNALQNVAVPLLFNHTKLSLIDAMSMERLKQLGIEHLAKKKVSKLSGGEKQRVAIARALVNQPEIILADEPTGALDKANAEMIMNIFKQLHQEGKTIIIVTHEEFVANACDRIITISDGKIAN